MLSVADKTEELLDKYLKGCRMESVSAKTEELLDKYLTIKPTPRVKRLREAFLQLKPRIAIDSERIIVRVMKETEGEPMVTRRAKAFAAVVREMPVNIGPDQLFVGYTRSQEGVPIVSEMGPEFESIMDLPDVKAILSDEDEKALREEILPYWRGAQGKYERTRWGRNYQLIPPELLDIYYVDPAAYPPMPTRTGPGGANSWHIGHEVLDWKKVLKKGFLGIKKEAEERLAGIDYANPDEIRKVPFLKAVVMAMEAAADVGKRFAAKARELAEKETDAGRKADLLKIAETCNWVPANPARTFYEALQSFRFAYIMAYWETMDTAGISVGRMDQYLYPYYESDIREGRITKAEAQELIDCWLMKLQEDGTLASHLSVGGIKADGSDATNELSYMFIEAMMHIRLAEPDFGVLIHSGTPDDLLIKGCQLCLLGFGQPMFQNADVMVSSLLARGTLCGPPVTLEDARNCDQVGCLEPFIAGKDGLHDIGGHTNNVLPLECALNNGVDRYYHKKLGVETGDPRQFKSFEEVREAYLKQQAWFVKNDVICDNIRALTRAEMHPTIYQSALLGCIESGICREAGGCRYNAGPGFFATGLPDVADSLTAIRKVVFEDKKITMEQLCDALDNNFEGYEDVRKMLLKAPKFGNDDAYADEQMSWVVHEWATEVMKQKNTNGGYAVPGVLALFMCATFGEVTGALPSGRLSGEPLSDGISPTPGSDFNGPTAVLKSVSKVNNVECSGGAVLNMSLDPVVHTKADGLQRLASLLRTLVDLKVWHVQFNVVSADTLRAAQKEPDKYRELMVRVAGYTAYFVTLFEGLQNQIIARTEHRL